MGKGQKAPLKPTLQEIARLAYIEGLTAQEAGKKWNVSYISLRKIICRYNMPTLMTTYERNAREQFARMTDIQLRSYEQALRLPKNARVSQKERDYLRDEMKNRFQFLD